MGDNKKELLKTIESNTKLDPEDKKDLGLILEDEFYRDKLSRKLSGMLLKEAVNNPGNYKEHDKLAFVHTDAKFLKNCISIVKNI